MEEIKIKYNELCSKRSDINEHLPTLYDYATKCSSIFETGVRGVISSWSFVYGLANNNLNEKKLFMNDIEICDNKKLTEMANMVGVSVEHEWINNLHINMTQNYDLIFIDTWHVYGQLKRELNKFAPFANKYIVLHDTTVDGIRGETVRLKWDAVEQSKQSGIPVDEINKGLWPAVEEFLLNNKDWALEKRYTNNNGLTILKKIDN